MHSECDIAIVGAGLAGTASAHILARSGYQVTLVDLDSLCPEVFRAEKLEPEQIALLKKLRLFQTVEPCLTPIKKVLAIRGAMFAEYLSLEQYAMPYHDLVNSLRGSIGPQVQNLIGRVSKITADRASPTISLDDGREVKAKLVVLACGVSPKLARALNLERKTVQREQSLSLGFFAEAVAFRGCKADSLTIYSKNPQDQVGYLTLFPFADRLRANLFTYWSPRSTDLKEFVAAPDTHLKRLFPLLEHYTGELSVAGKIETGPVHLYQTEIPAVDGVVAIGDAFQSVCPTTGMGLSKVLTDVDLLCNIFAPQWLSAGERSAQKLQGFYRQSEKIRVDQDSLNSAWYQRQIALNNSAAWRVRRAKLTLKGVSLKLRESIQTACGISG